MSEIEHIKKKKKIEPIAVPVHQREQIMFLWEEYIKYLKKKKKSSLEIDEIEKMYQLSASFALDTSEFDREHTDSNMEMFLKTVIPQFDVKFSPKKSTVGKPVLVIVCQSAIRCVNVIRLLSQFNKMCKIGKMFSKHMKIQDQINYLNENICKIVVATPSRLVQLHKECRILEKCEYFMIDMWKSSKEQTVLQIKDCAVPIFEDLLPIVFELMQNDLKILFY